MIFNLYQRLAIKVGDDERHIFDQKRLMFTEVAEIEKISGLSYAEWATELGRYSAAGIGPLVHILRKREGQSSDYATLQFNMAEFSAVPLKDDDSEFTPEEVAADLVKRMEKVNGDAGPILAAAAAVAPESGPGLTLAPSTKDSSPRSSTSVPGNGASSPTPTSSRARRTATAS
jgi:hypothetical protein